MYVVTKFVKRLSNVTDDQVLESHPSHIRLEDGTILKTDYDSRTDALIEQYEKYDSGKWNGYAYLHPQVRFKVLREWDQDACTCGSKIRWEIPKTAKLIYP